MSNIKKNFVYNSFYQILLILLPLITTPYISRVLGKEKIGLYSYSYSIAVYFGIFIMFGLNNYGNRTIAAVREKGKKELSKAFCSIYAMQLLFGFLTTIFYFIYVLIYADDTLMSVILYLYMLSTLLDINWFYFGLEQFKLTVTRNTVIKIISTIMIFTFVKDDTDIYIYAIILMGGLLLSQIVLFFFLPRYIKYVKISLADIIKHIKPNLVLFVPVIAVSIYKVMDKVMLGFFIDYSEVGIYENSEKIISIPTAFITALGTVMLPRTTNLIACGKIKESRKYISSSLIFSMFLSCAMCFGIIGILPEFVPLFFGPGYEKCTDVIAIVILSSLFLSWGNVIRTQYLIPMQLDKIYIKSAIYGAIINFIINMLLIFNYKSVGTAIGTLFAEAVVCIYQCFRIRKRLNFRKFLIQTIPFLIIGVSMVFLISNLYLFESSMLNILCKVIIGMLYYLLLSFLIILFYKRKKVL